MRTTLRLVVFGAIVSVIMFTFAPPVDGQASRRVAVNAPLPPPSMTQLPPPGSRDVSGTYTGFVTVTATGEMPGGTIVITQMGSEIGITAGPSLEEQYKAERVEQTPKGLRFEVPLPGDDAVQRLHFDVAIDGRRLSGVAVFVRDGEESGGLIEFRRQ